MKVTKVDVAIGLAIVAIVVSVAVGLVISSKGNQGLGAINSNGLNVTSSQTTVNKGNLNVTGVLWSNGDGTYKQTGSLVGNASTTILSLQNPFGVTSTVNLVRLIMTNVATTSFAYQCGTSTSNYAAADFGPSIISSDTIATGTNAQYMESGCTTACGQALSSGSLSSKIEVGPGSYLICKAKETYTSTKYSWVTSTNAFAGTYAVSWSVSQ